MAAEQQVYLAEGFPKLDSARDGKASFGMRAVGYTFDEIAGAFSAAQALAPEVLFGLLKADFSIEPFENSETEWTILFNYNREGWAQHTLGAYGESPAAELEFDVSYEMQRVTTALSQTTIGPAAPDFGLAVNVNKDREVEGVDIPTPTETFSETHYFNPSEITSTYLRALFVNVGKTNANTFRGHDPGEVRYLGARFKTRGREPIGIDFRFAASVNIENYACGTDPAGNTLTVPLKRAWEYLWKWNTVVKDEAQAAIVTKPLGVYVAQVSHSVNFAFLNIPQGDFQIGV